MTFASKSMFDWPPTSIKTKPKKRKAVKLKPAPLGVNSKLFDMLSYMRPHNTKAERDWTQRFIIDPHIDKVITYGHNDSMAFAIEVGTGSKTLFSAHVDTVHHLEGPQKLVYDPVMNHLFKDDGDPLGADDGSGVWLLLEMIGAGVPGTYLFTRGEECGGIGAKYMAEYHPEFLAQFERAIAFDRKAKDSVITHQAHGRCCSDNFAEALAEALNGQNGDFMYSPDDTGIYTDTAEYTGEIAECTNVSVGYYDEHTGREMQDLDHLMQLRDACLRIEWELLPTDRDPKKVDKEGMSWFWNSRHKDPVEEEDEWMTRDDMIAAARKDPEAFVDELRLMFYGVYPPRKEKGN
jgi:hypothetical protein